MLSKACGQPDTADQADEALPPPPPVPRECIRCKEPPTFTQRGTAYCHSCFLQVLSGRFSRALEGARTVSAAGFDAYESPEPRPRRKDRAPDPDGKVVVAFSGGSSSRAVLELLRMSSLAAPSSATAPSAAVHAGARKKGKKHGLPMPPVFADCEVVFVDESCVVPGTAPGHIAEIREIVTTGTPFRFTALALEDVFSPAYSASADPLVAGVSASLPLLPSRTSCPTPATARERLVALAAPLSPSGRASLLAALRHALLVAHARTQSARILLLGSTGTRLAIDVLAGMASGRGWSAGEDAGAEYVSRPVTGARGGEVLVVRPLALVSAREARYLCESEGLRHVDAPQPTEAAAEREREQSAKGRSIGALVEDFILSLDASFPSTAQTVVRTAHKFGLRSSAPEAHLCALCGAPAQPAAAAWRAAITISDLAGAHAALADGAGVGAGADEGVETRAPAWARALPEGRGGVRAPYAPSAAHLLPAWAASADDPVVPTFDPEPAAAVAAGRRAESEEPEPASLAAHLCYGCLLVLQEPGSAPVAKGRTRAAELVLPPFVADVVRARAVRGQEDERAGGEVVGVREVHGVEAMREEVAGFLLDDEA
ncbi:hypothetical protein JCM3770_006095 [Rhodotorula araucariae]